MIFAKITSTAIITARASNVGTIVVWVWIVLHPCIQALTVVALVFVVLIVAGQLKLPTTVGKTLNRAIITNMVTTIPIATCTSCIISDYHLGVCVEDVFKRLIIPSASELFCMSYGFGEFVVRFCFYYAKGTVTMSAMTILNCFLAHLIFSRSFFSVLQGCHNNKTLLVYSPRQKNSLQELNHRQSLFLWLCLHLHQRILYHQESHYPSLWMPEIMLQIFL